MIVKELTMGKDLVNNRLAVSVRIGGQKDIFLIIVSVLIIGYPPPPLRISQSGLLQNRLWGRKELLLLLKKLCEVLRIFLESTSFSSFNLCFILDLFNAYEDL